MSLGLVSEKILTRLKDVQKTGDGWMATCPAHEDKRPSLSIKEGDDGRILLKCFAGCSVDQIVSAVGLKIKDLFPKGEGGGVHIPRKRLHTCTHDSKPIEKTTKSRVQPQNGDLHTCTLGDYAQAKKLPVGFLRRLSLADVDLKTGKAVRIPYFDNEGNEVATRYRLSLSGKDRFRWRRGSKPFLYGLWRLSRGADYVILVEGESDCHTLWWHGFNAVGLPGAANWREDRDVEWLEGFDRIYIVQEPDRGGEAVRRWLTKSKIKDRAYIVELIGYKDPSELHTKDPQQFKHAFQEALDRAIPFSQIEVQIRNKRAKEAWAKCEELARCPNILERFRSLLPSCSLAGEEKLAQILYLALTSRFLDRPVSVVVTGGSSGGKSHLVETVLKFFPKSAYHDLTGMSERALIYSEEPLSHRFLVIYEAAGLTGEFGTYLIRSLLSEGRVKYEFTEKTKEGLKPRLIEKEGPTGLIMTTTLVWLHPENETRVLTVTINDTREQTQNVLLALAQETKEPNLEEWQVLQTWFECQGPVKVVIPYAVDLARLTKPIALRLRRDFGALLSLIKAHAILHMASRERDKEGRIIATLEDYAAVLDFVGDVIAEGVEATVPESVKETVSAVRELLEASSEEPPYTTVSKVAKKLNLDRSAALRRLKTAIRRGFVKELEGYKKAKEKKYTLGEPLPTEAGGIFPTPEELKLCKCANGQTSPAHLKSQENQPAIIDLCRCAGGVGGNEHTPPKEELDFFEDRKKEGGMPGEENQAALFEIEI